MKIFNFLLLLTFFSCSGPGHKASRGVASDERKWGFLVLSDIHVYTSTKAGKKIVPPGFSELVKKLVPYVEKNNIKFVVLLGDSTGGNENDRHSLATVQMWWDQLHSALMPLMEKGVRIIPVAGNHDFYTQNHQDGYKYAWKTFVNINDSELQIKASNPLYYTVSYAGMELYMLHAVNYNLGAEQEAWLTKTTQENKDNGMLKMAFGHYNLYTRLIKKPFESFGKKIGKILLDGNVKHYIGGHEHFFWDELVSTQLRQTIVGTSSGTYNYSPHINHYSRVCKEKVCTLGPDNLRIPVNASNRMQVYKQMFLHIEVDEDLKHYKMNPKAFHKGEVIPFNLP